MDDPIGRRTAMAAGAVGLASLGGCLRSTLGDGGDTDGGGGDGDTPLWLTAELTDVRTDETFAVGGFDRPVLLETFAVWCSKCLQQQKQLRELHERVGDDVVSIGLNIDPNEDAGKVRDHLETHGFDWRYAISPSAVTESLVDTFDQSVTVPPRAPVVLVCTDGAYRRLPDGVKSVEDLSGHLENGC